MGIPACSITSVVASQPTGAAGRVEMETVQGTERGPSGVSWSVGLGRTRRRGRRGEMDESPFYLSAYEIQLSTRVFLPVQLISQFRHRVLLWCTFVNIFCSMISRSMWSIFFIKLLSF